MTYESWRVKALEWEIEQAMGQGNVGLWLTLLRDYGYYAEDLANSRRNLEGVRKAEARAAQERAELADIYAEANDVDAAAERRQLADEYAQAQGYPAAGSFLGLLQPVFDLFESAPKGAAAPEPTGKSMPESPNGEPLAAVSIRTLLGPPDTNSSKF